MLPNPGNEWERQLSPFWFLFDAKECQFQMSVMRVMSGNIRTTFDLGEGAGNGKVICNISPPSPSPMNPATTFFPPAQLGDQLFCIEHTISFCCPQIKISSCNYLKRDV